MLFIFDMGGVLVRTSENDKPVMEMLNITREQLIEYSKDEKGQNLFELLTVGKISSTEYWQNFSKRSGIEINADYWRLLLHPQRIQEVYDLVTELKKKNRVICGTNTIQSHYDAHVCRSDYSIFDDVYASHHMGVAKPDVKFWQLILKAEHTKPEDAFFIDDRIENVEAAASLGIKTHHFSDCAKLRNDVAKWL